MKHTKKMVMVPETEYFALLNMLKGGNATDPLQGEKSILDAKIKKNLSDKKVGAEIKAKRHAWLYKRRKQLKDLVENRPQKVVIENPAAIPNIAPYMGIQKSKAKLEPTSTEAVDSVKSKRAKTFSQRKQGKNLKQTNGNTSGELNGSSSEYSSANNDAVLTTPSVSAKIKSPKNINKILNLIAKDPAKYGIEMGTGRVLSNLNKPITGSDYRESLKYLAGQDMSPPRGHKFFMQKIRRDEELQKYFTNIQQQSGEGKRRKIRKFVTVRTSSIKTPGLVRENANETTTKKPFKPVLWAKL